MKNHRHLTSTTPDKRRHTLKQVLENKQSIRVMETHSPLAALLVEQASYNKDGKVIEFDAFWSSSLTDSTVRGKPDIELLSLSSRLNSIADIFDVTTKPLILDGDTGGQIAHLPYHINAAEKIGVSSIIIEDKTGLKKNSLFGTDVKQTQDDPARFAEKIAAAKSAQLTDDFMVIARVESLILDAGMTDAIDRALTYVAAGADGIMIHSRKKDPQEIIEFSRIFKKSAPNVPLVCVPTSFNDITFDQLTDYGFNIVIYANHLLRASYPAMRNILEDILKNGRTLEIEDKCLPIKEILELIPGTK
ncbi:MULTISPECIES: phosphoenolpyruvate mutase [unclassified Brenneria]|uniref:phosphoenolpyruvate mutase n=1 Tax=unclassified Brenneria TaxID=2634434 RepID=UPI0015532488|nr:MULTISPECIES: phosphoenolpyruvate mutase [unclassified Brenneria]MBJ7221981.1 phosphoenolpyruvate mutase [Brenneria sp. L3-3C-1]MEE3643224.1 phosphoenolpyruvate mutase [Brenneria sp. L3_3C_1]MEE3650587.1 phosphoenolpyruvate mutase [Brenneria sp. HEZEL_4_2_4]NPD00542.1 phosphoenolpyruvate mutase [Brenneria sp. hezel4-2-4]